MGTLIRLVLRLALLGLVGAVAGALYARGRLVSRGEPDDDEVELVGIFEGFELASRAGAFRGGTLLAWFGGGTLDLRGATLAPTGARLTVHALFGGAQLVVPDDWDVECRLVGVAGGLGDDRARHRPMQEGHDSGGADHGPTLTIDGWAAFGGVGVTSERRGPPAG